MNTEEELLQRLVISKKIMEKHNDMGRGKSSQSLPSAPMVEDYQPVNAKYNLPNDLLMSEAPQPTIKQSGPMTADKIVNSKLPDEIKKLMLEHPISQPQSMGGPTLSNELVDKAARLMSVDASGKQVNEIPRRKNDIIEESYNNNQNLRSILKEVVTEVLEESGLLVESEKKSNETFKFRVGNHIFEGTLTKIKKINK